MSTPTNELPTTTVTRAELAAVLDQPGFRAYALLGAQTCPGCGERCNGAAFAPWLNEGLIRSQWRCITPTCHLFDQVFNLTTTIVDDAAPAQPAAAAPKLSLVKTRQGTEVHLGVPGLTTTVGHQLPSARSITFVDYYAKDVTCEVCRATDAYQTWQAARQAPAAPAAGAAETAEAANARWEAGIGRMLARRRAAPAAPAKADHDLGRHEAAPVADCPRCQWQAERTALLTQARAVALSQAAQTFASALRVHGPDAAILASLARRVQSAADAYLTALETEAAA